MLNNVANKILLNILRAGKSWPTFSPLELFGKFIKSPSLFGEGGKSFYMILGFVNFCRRFKIDCSSGLTT